MVAPSPPTDDSVDLREYVAVLSRRKWLILAFTVLFTALALAYSFTATPVYTGVTEILLQPPATLSTFRPDQLVSLETEARIVASGDVATTVIEQLGLESTVPGLLDRVEVATTPDTLVLDIMFTAGGAQQAADGANAFAEQYLQFKYDRAQEVLDTRVKTIDNLLTTRAKDLKAADAKVARTSPTHPDYEDLVDERDTIERDVDALVDERNEIPATPDEAGTIILPAEPPRNPSSPNHKLNLAMGLVLGLFLGVVVAFARDRIDDKIGDRADLESVITVLATIPRAAIPGNDRSVLVTEAQPRSPAAEAYRSLRTSVMAMRRQTGDSVFAIASPMLGDGKSTTTANLAAALSHADKRVLVISADLRRPSLHAFFGTNNDIGLAEVLTGEVRFNDAVQAVAPNLVLLPSGAPPARPAEILQSQGMRELIRRERERYDFILIDCPPVLGITDTVTIAPFVDSVIMVARAEKTKRSLFVESMDALAQVGAASGGAVINDVATARGTYAYGYGPDTRTGRFGRKTKRRRAARKATRNAPERPAAERPGSTDGSGSRPLPLRDPETDDVSGPGTAERPRPTT